MKRFPQFIFSVSKCERISFFDTNQQMRFPPMFFKPLVKHLMNIGNELIIEFEDFENDGKMSFSEFLLVDSKSISVHSGEKKYEEFILDDNWQRLEHWFEKALLTFSNSSIEIFFDPVAWDLCLISYSKQDEQDVTYVLEGSGFYSNRSLSFDKFLEYWKNYTSPDVFTTLERMLKEHYEKFLH